MASSCPSLSIFSSPLSFIKPLQASMLAFSPCRREVTLLPRLNHHHHQQYRQRYQKEKNHPTWIRRSSSAGNGGFFFSDNIETVRSPTDIAKHFYRSINGKDLYQLEGCFADDCVFEDLAFPFPFQGVQVILDIWFKIQPLMRLTIMLKFNINPLTFRNIISVLDSFTILLITAGDWEFSQGFSNGNGRQCAVCSSKHRRRFNRKLFNSCRNMAYG